MEELKSSLKTLEYPERDGTIRGKMSSINRSYVAGFFDGEGCVAIGYTYGNSRIRLKNIANNKRYYGLKIDIGQTDDSVLREIQSYYGGSICKNIPKKGNPIWRWIATGKNANNFLRDMIPFLRLKKERARLGLYFYNHRHHLTDEDKLELRLKISSLNGNKSHGLNSSPATTKREDSLRGDAIV